MLKGRYLKQAHLVVFLFVSLCALIVLFSLLREDNNRIATKQEQAGQQLNESIINALNGYELEVAGLAALFHSSQFVSALEFDTFSQTLINHKRIPVYNSFYAESVLATQKQNFIADRTQRSNGPFRILPEGERPLYLPITYAFPDKRFVGVDTLEKGVFFLYEGTQDWNTRQTKLIKPKTANDNFIVKPSQSSSLYVLSKNVYKDDKPIKCIN